MKIKTEMKHLSSVAVFGSLSFSAAMADSSCSSVALPLIG